LFDWDVYRLAIEAFFHGGNPYQVGEGFMRFYNPPWTIFIMAPFTLARGYAMLVLAIVSTMILAIIGRRWGLKPLGVILLVTSAFNYQTIMAGNAEAIAWLGLFLPPGLGIFFFLIKPQSTIGMVAFLLYRRWQTAGVVGVVRLLAVPVLLTLGALALWGLPPIVPCPCNRSLFPYSLLLGIPALLIAMRQQRPRWAAFSGPFLTPYVAYHGYLPVLFAFRGVGLLLVWVLTWIPIALYGITF